MPRLWDQLPVMLVRQLEGHVESGLQWYSESNSNSPILPADRVSSKISSSRRSKEA